jgi:hypothetical protein
VLKMSCKLNGAGVSPTQVDSLLTHKKVRDSGSSGPEFPLAERHIIQ